MINFTTHIDCKDCQLCESAKHPGIPTRVFRAEGHDRALLIVGMAPGYHEDEEGMSWVGWSGDILGKFINAMKLPGIVDVYLSNALRCKVPSGMKPTASQITKCRPYLLMDIQKLLDEYTELIVLACGADAAKSVADVKSLGQGFKLQGYKDGTKSMEILSHMPTLFFTYHPAILAPGRKPEKVDAIQSHFILLRRYLTGEFIPNELQVVPEPSPEVPETLPDIISIDIETYGILKGREQTVFTPAKSRQIDNVPYGKQIVTVAIAYRDCLSLKSPGRIRTAVFRWSNSAERNNLRVWIKRAIESGCVLLGQNFKYDLLYLILNDRYLAEVLSPCRAKVDDTLVKAFLLDEQRPERGLKELSLLFGIADYSKLAVTGKLGNAKSSSDPDLLYYNCLDAAATLVLDEQLVERMKQRYGKDSAKLGPVCAEMRNAIIWDAVGMEKAGTRIDIPRLESVNDEYTTKYRAAVAEGKRLGVKFEKEGSKKSLLEFVVKALGECGLLTGGWLDGRVERTDVKKEISTGQANMNLVLKYLPEGDTRTVAEQFHIFQEFSHLRNTYSNKLLVKQREGIVQRVKDTGLIYPEWYPVPSVFDKGSSNGKETSGGTIQGRITARKPPHQTYPEDIKNCLKSRFPAGRLVEWDLNRIELVVAAWLSGDPVLIKALLEGDPHDDTTFDMFPGITKEDPTFNEKRKLAKVENFLVIYRGGASAFQQAARRDLGIELEIGFCQDSIDAWYRKHPVHKAWQEQMIEIVERQGYLELPTGWSRTFGKGRENAMHAVNEICNFPVQTTAAQLMLSAQFQILQGLTEQRMRAVMCAQAYDSVVLDVPYDEGAATDKLVDGALTNPPLRGILEYALGRTMPIEYKRKVLA
jgi:uracil-DNA glycosylase family 4